MRRGFRRPTRRGRLPDHSFAVVGSQSSRTDNAVSANDNHIVPREGANRGPSANDSAASESTGFFVSAPTVSLPKGGGAIRGMGEKFAANPVTGTGSMSVPIATSPGRSGFGPQLSLSYDSGSGNGPFGFGWSLSLPFITRKTDKGLPQYNDADETDVFILSGAEDLVPELKPDGTRHRDDTTAPGYIIERYRPRIEGLFARIERWTRRSDGDVHWRSISRDNILTLYGKDAGSRVADPEDALRIFTWLICETRDDKGNAVLYEYNRENGVGVDLTRAHERNRGDRKDARRSANHYLKTIRYGNRSTLLDSAGHRPRFLADLPEAQIQSAGWMFEVVFDYGEHDANEPKPDDAGLWTYRDDPFSSYRPGFEVRTTRLCQRVLMFHHFEGELGVGKDCLVRSTDFTYSHQQDPLSARNPVYAFLLAVTQSGYRRSAGAYEKQSLPPVAFEYTQPIVQDTVEDVDSASLENLPIGVDGASYQWTDLHGEGIPGILTEQAGAWFYKRNLSPISERPVELATLERVAATPNLALAGGQAQFMDLAGDGQPDLVVFDGPTPGLYEHDGDEGWQPFRPFTSRLNRDIRDPNLKFVDLDGDGHADVLITEDDALVWHASLAEEGFGQARRVAQTLDEEKGPRLVFADGTQSIYLADLSGDGLTDLVRIRNGEVCYWPNLGYGRFGAKVTMDHAAHFDGFDNPDQFDHKRIRLADIDGTGTTDIIYLHRDGVRLYFNQSGNSWSEAQQLNVFPRVDDLVSIVPTDLLGNGTACLVWSSPLPGDAQRPMMRYVNLMGGQKPHLLIKTINNLGAETVVQYAPSTKFYLLDKYDGKPWITRLPFPVHVVEKVTVTDKWRKTSFSSTYSYHHGYFDGVEREFRGFGRVEQLDTESYGEFAKGNSASPYITDDHSLYQPPVKTITWFHTGAVLDRQRILTQFQTEYFPNSLAALPSTVTIDSTFEEKVLPEPDLESEDLTADEWREALRACKGMTLRQEVYELAVDALQSVGDKLPTQIPVRLFSTTTHNCGIRRLQPKGDNQHAVFLVAESEALSYHYELDLRPHAPPAGVTTIPPLKPDPRVAHTLNLNCDEYGNVLQSVAVVYPRSGQFEDSSVKPDDLALIQHVQKERHLAYSETRYTQDVLGAGDYRLRLPREVLTYELIIPEARDNRPFTLDELGKFGLSDVYEPNADPTEITTVAAIPYQATPNQGSYQKRLVEYARTLFFAENLVDPLPFGEHGRLGLAYESYKLALTDSLLDAVFKDATGNNKLDQIIDGARSARAKLNDPATSGYLSGTDLFAPLPVADPAGQYWVRSGVAGFAPDAAQHFYLPERYTDAFGNVTTLEFDVKSHLFVQSSTDALSNSSRVTQFDFRVLAPREMQDINNNLSEVFFDVLGLPTAMAVKGKGDEGDNLLGFDSAAANVNRTQPSLAALRTFFDAADLVDAQARDWLGNATARHIYDFGQIEETRADGATVTRWAQYPPCACGLVREQHVSQLAPVAHCAIQAAFEYSDGIGSVIVKKIQAEPEGPGQPLRWVVSGKTILNNKGKPVKQYEPYFTSPEVGHGYEEPADVGVTAVIYYDAVGRTVRTEMPDGSYSRVEFSPWHVRSFDQNDTVKEPRNPWFMSKTAATAAAEEKRAAQLAAEHADTPALIILDSLGREVISIAHNRVNDAAGVLKDERYLTFTKLDAEGKPLWIRDARGNLVMQYITQIKPARAADEPDQTRIEALPANAAPCYDIAGNLLFQHSMDAGDRWMLNDAAGKPMCAWDSRGHTFLTEYDTLHRPVASFVKGADPLDADRIIQFETVIYGDTPGNGLADTPPVNDQTRQLNLRGKPYKHFDTAGLVISLGRNPVTGTDEAFDFKGNPLRSTRHLVTDYKQTPDWSQTPALERETFTSSTRYDALNRPIQLVAPHSDQPGATLNVIRPGYNEANLLKTVDVWLEQTTEPTGLLNQATASVKAVTNIDYDAKGQRLVIEYNDASHPVLTKYSYDKDTFRLIRLLSTRPAHPETDKRRLQDLTYTYDPVGNITAIRDDAQQRVFFDNSSVEPSNAYVYDALYRLIHAEGREHAAQNYTQRDAEMFERIIGIPFPNSPEALQRYTEEYEYDPLGNILGFHHSSGGTERWVRWYQYALDSNRLLATRLPSAAGKLPFYAAIAGYDAKYTYDAHGNMTSMLHLKVMEWDFKDQLSASQQQVRNDGAGEKTWYVYDASGQRVRKFTETQTGTPKDECIYLGGCELYRKYNDNIRTVTLERYTLHVMDDRQRVALIETRTRPVGAAPAFRPLVRFQLGNHLGSASLECDDGAQVISYEEYHPYGSTAYQSARSQPETSKRYRYTGKERDEETGFSYHGARYYAPWLGRWVSSDPAGVDGGLDLFAFVRGSPIRLVDMDGARPKEGVFVLSPSSITFTDKTKQSLHFPAQLIAITDRGTQAAEQGFQRERRRTTRLLPKTLSTPIMQEDNYLVLENVYLPDLGGYLERDPNTRELRFYSGPTPEELVLQTETRSVEDNMVQRSQELDRAAEMFKYDSLLFATSQAAGAAAGEWVAGPLLSRAFAAAAAEGTEGAASPASITRSSSIAPDPLFEPTPAGAGGPESAAPTEVRIYRHTINKGGLADILDQQALLSTEGPYEDAVRAYVGPVKGPYKGLTPTIEFTTGVEPSVGPSMGGSTARWYLPAGEQLPIRVQKIYYPDGSVVDYSSGSVATTPSH
jgi:RHS repeat-associated protein